MDKLYAGLKDLANERRAKLDDALKLFRLNREVDDLEQWIAEKEVTFLNLTLEAKILLTLYTKQCVCVYCVCVPTGCLKKRGEREIGKRGKEAKRN